MARRLSMAKKNVEARRKRAMGYGRSNYAGARRPRPQAPVDEQAARELELYIENDSELYHRQTQPILKNLSNKMANGKYDHEKAVKLFGYLMESGAKKYAREFASPGEWSRMFNVPTRKHAARAFARGFEVEYGTGAYHHYLTGAAKKRLAARG